MTKSLGVKEKLKNFEDLFKIVIDLKKQGKKIVWTNGCFDILHKGHVNHLNESSQQGDILIIGLNSDSSTRALKGPERPKMPQDERAELLSSFGSVDYIIIYDELSPAKYIASFMPDVYVKGGEYNIDTCNQDERKIVEAYGGKIVFTSDKVNSTTSIIERIKKEINNK